MELADLFSSIFNANTIGGFILATFFTFLGIVAKSLLDNKGQVTVAKINSETTLGAKAIETLTMALEVLQEENKTMKASAKQLEGHVDTLIDHIIDLVKATNKDDADKAIVELERYIRSIGRWPR